MCASITYGRKHDGSTFDIHPQSQTVNYSGLWKTVDWQTTFSVFVSGFLNSSNLATSVIIAGCESLMTLTRVKRVARTPESRVLYFSRYLSYRIFLRFLLTKEDLGFSKNSTYLTSLKYSWPKDLYGLWLPRAVFLNRRAAARYRALASIIPGRERFSWNL